jgi:hypothetical protein
MRPEAARPPEPRHETRPPQTQPEQGWSHPLAKPAPTVQPKSERQAQDEESKFHQWQQQREKAAPPRPEARKPPSKEDKPHDKK